MIQERSDEQVLWERRKFTVSERVPEPIEMSDTEILDWMEASASVLRDDGQFWHLDVCGRSFSSDSIRGVVIKASAKFRDMYE